VLAGVILLALAAIAWFDLGPRLNFLDDWLYAWSARQLAAGHGTRVMPGQSAVALVQLYWSFVFSLGHPDIRLLRLSELPVAALGAWGVMDSARRLGADRCWSLGAAAGFITFPMLAALATSYMTDAFYVSLYMAALAMAVRWAIDGGGRVACLVLTALTVLERQHGYGIPLALSVGLLVARRRRHVDRGAAVWAGGLWLVTLAAVLTPALTGTGTINQAERIQGLLHFDAPHAFQIVAYLPALTGLVAVPFAVGLAQAPAPGPRSWVRWPLLALAALGVATACVLTVEHAPIFPGDVWTPVGLMPPHVVGHKVPLYGAPVFYPLEALAVVAFSLLLLRHGETLAGRLAGPGQAVLVTAAVTQLLPMLETPVLDRYYLAILAPLLPIAAALASAAPRQWPARVWLIAGLVANLLIYVAGEQDYQAWQVARDAAERSLLATTTADRINGGLEANAVYWETPYFESHGRPPGDVLTNPLSAPSLNGPPNAVWELRFAHLGDPRPGFDYHSLAPGRIVVSAKQPGPGTTAR
jgi:hypothetical protein